MGCPKLKTENWRFVSAEAAGRKRPYLFHPEKNRSISAPAEMDDANKNVGQLLDSSGSIVAKYEYSPFGKITSSSGTYANDNPFLFSSEYLDSETNLVYYNYRYYSPELGRWTKRDKIGERGGWNLYGMLSNNTINLWDYLGYGELPFPLNNPLQGLLDIGKNYINNRIKKVQDYIKQKIDGIKSQAYCLQCKILCAMQKASELAIPTSRITSIQGDVGPLFFTGGLSGHMVENYYSDEVSLFGAYNVSAGWDPASVNIEEGLIWHMDKNSEFSGGCHALKGGVPLPFPGLGLGGTIFASGNSIFAPDSKANGWKKLLSLDLEGPKGYSLGPAFSLPMPTGKYEASNYTPPLQITPVSPRLDKKGVFLYLGNHFRKLVEKRIKDLKCCCD